MYNALEEAYKKLDSETDTYYKVIENHESALGAFESGNNEKKLLKSLRTGQILLKMQGLTLKLRKSAFIQVRKFLTA